MGHGSPWRDPWPMWPIEKSDPFDPLTHDPLTHCLLWTSHLCASVTKQYNLVPAKGRWCSAAGKVTTGLAECNGSLPPGGWLIVTCGLTACTPGSALGPTLGNEYRKPLPFKTSSDYNYLSDEQLMSLLASAVKTRHQTQPRCPVMRLRGRPLPASHRVIDESDPAVAITVSFGLYAQHML